MLFRAAGVFYMLAASLQAIEIGDRMPDLKDKTLTGKEIVLPADIAGKVALLSFGFTYQSRFPVEEFTRRFRADFGEDTRLTFFEIPMIGGMAILGKWFIDSGMRRGTSKPDQDHVITVYGGTGDWKKILDVKEQDAAYLLLLDKDGKVAWKYGGVFDEARYAELAAKCRALLL